MDLSARWKAIIRAVVGMPAEGGPPRYDRMAMYRATVVSCASDGSTCDLQPEDARIAGEKNVPVRVGIPGLVAVVSGGVVLMGWERGDPARPYCVPSWEGGVPVTKLVLKAAMLYLGDESGAGELVKKIEFVGHTHDIPALSVVGGGGGSTATGVTGGAASITGTTNVKAK